MVIGMNDALVLSGGLGSRLGTKIPKQYLRIGKKMLIIYALEALAASDRIDRIWIVAEEKWWNDIMREAEMFCVSEHGRDKIRGFVNPGASRQESIWNGLCAIHELSDESTPDTILIHDAARPCLTGELIADCYEALPGHDGVMPVLPMKDTVYYSQNGDKVDELLERNHIYAGQAPELFLFDKYFKANEALLPETIGTVKGSTEVAVRAGMDVAMIPGDERNFKVTTAEDMRLFERICESLAGNV